MGGPCPHIGARSSFVLNLSSVQEAHAHSRTTLHPDHRSGQIPHFRQSTQRPGEQQAVHDIQRHFRMFRLLLVEILTRVMRWELFFTRAAVLNNMKPLSLVNHRRNPFPWGSSGCPSSESCWKAFGFPTLYHLMKTVRP